MELHYVGRSEENLLHQRLALWVIALRVARDAASENGIGLNSERGFINMLQVRFSSSWLLTYLGFLILFVGLSILPSSILTELPKAISGLLAVVLFPGLAWGRSVLPQKMSNAVGYMIVGIILNMASIQGLFFFTLVTAIEVPLAMWLVLSSLILVISGSLAHEESIEFHLLSSWKPHKTLYILLVFAWVLRIALALVAVGTIAPDAALYSEFARGMIDGGFSSLIVNEGAVFELWKNTHAIYHQGFVFVSALSFVLMTPTTSGPQFILTVIGTLVIIPAKYYTERFFGETAGDWVSLILAIHPLFTFHSAIAYGPEITSLLLMMTALVILLHDESKKGALLVSGIALGFIDFVWYPNFYIVCLIIPLTLYALREVETQETIAALGAFAVVLISRVLATRLLYFMVCWAILLVYLILTRNHISEKLFNRIAPLCAGIFVSLSLAKLPIQAAALLGQVSSAGPDTAPLVEILFRIPQPALLIRFLLFLLFHLSIVIAGLLVLAAVRHGVQRRPMVLVLSAAIGAAGTLQVFGSFEKESLILDYIYSDSRFFLFPIIMLIIALGSFLREYDLPSLESSHLSLHVPRKSKVIGGLVLVGFLPGFLFFPQGMMLIDIDSRYGWMDIKGALGPIDDDALFILDRAREFSWLTGRRSVTLNFSDVKLPFENYSRELLSYAYEYNAQYFIIDDYTVSRWGILDYALGEELLIGDRLFFDATSLRTEWNDTMNTALSLRLISQTEPNEYGRIARAFGFANATYTRSALIDLLSPGWTATNNGIIEAYGSETRIVVQSELGYTNTKREEGLTLSLNVTTGFILFDIQEHSGHVPRIEIWDSEGNFVRYAEPLNQSAFFFPLCRTDVGDVRIVVEGQPGDYVTVNSITVWQTS